MTALGEIQTQVLQLKKMLYYVGVILNRTVVYDLHVSRKALKISPGNY